MIIIVWKHITEAKVKLCHITHGRTLTVREFRGSSKSPTLWTSKRTMQAWNSQRYIFGQSIPVGFAFKRPWEGGHGLQSQHYAGVAFDVCQTCSNSKRTSLSRWNNRM